MSNKPKRFLIELTAPAVRSGHSMVVNLKKIYPDSEFVLICGFPYDDQSSLGFLKNQKDVEYKKIYLRYDLMRKALKSEIDMKALKEFEDDTQLKSIWRMVAADRNLGIEYMHGAHWIDTVLTQDLTREKILKIFTGILQNQTEIFEEFKPDVFIPAPAMTCIDIYINEYLCRKMGVYYLVPMTCRVENLFTFGNDVHLDNSHIEQFYQNVINGKTSLDLTQGQKLYDALMADRKGDNYFDRQHPSHHYKMLDTFSAKVTFVAKALKSIGGVIFRWFKEAPKRRSQDIKRQPNNFKTLRNNIKFIAWRHIHSYSVLTKKIGTTYDPKQKYVYFPLHINPENSTQIQATMWLDQIHIIELLSKSIPADWIVYVKEHPTTMMYRSRPKDFYKRIERLPNVEIVPINTEMNDLISHAQMVAVISGTAGWEAILRSIPLINFGKRYWDVMELSRCISNTETLPQVIHEEIKRQGAITAEERERRLVAYLATIDELGFRVTHTQQFVNYEPGTDEMFDEIGNELAQGLVKHLANLNNLSQQKVNVEQDHLVEAS